MNKNRSEGIVENLKCNSFCKSVIRYIDQKLEGDIIIQKYKIDYSIILRADGKITFTTTREDRNLITLTTNKTRNYLSEIEVHLNGKISDRRVMTLECVDKYILITSELLEELYRTK
ncbi:hypothetical protein [Clostridium sp.]|uniref:hypothetical protein n=1 Tax=Clostridium sp. TaxID=1506 RepID=UPI00283D623C|nr:hypothetical protein [Clostridium sp.]MDR3598566.1 hypothetical protein [Clostridium sp.]